jgi:uncharacterized protein YecT (DUF1311 family)
MDPAAVANWPEQLKRTYPFDADQKAWLDEHWSDYQKSKAEGSSGKVLAHEIAVKMEDRWPVTRTRQRFLKSARVRIRQRPGQHAHVGK